jgi:hypothetical protein
MVVLIALLASWLAFRIAGAAGVLAVASWEFAALCAGRDVGLHWNSALQQDEA